MNPASPPGPPRAPGLRAPAPYDHADLYDLDYAGHVEDVGFYTGLAREVAGRPGPPVVELGAGTGRLTLPLAEIGPVLAVVAHEGMLARLRARLAQRPELDARVTVVAADLRDVELPHGGRLVLLPFNVLNHLGSVDEVRALFARIAEHLAPGGRFALDAYLPEPGIEGLHGQVDVVFRMSPRDGRRWRVVQRTEVDVGGRLVRTRSRWEGPEGVVETVLEQRLFRLSALLQAARDAGLQAETSWSDFDGRAASADAPKWVAVLRKGA